MLKFFMFSKLFQKYETGKPPRVSPIAYSIQDLSYVIANQALIFMKLVMFYYESLGTSIKDN